MKQKDVTMFNWATLIEEKYGVKQEKKISFNTILNEVKVMLEKIPGYQWKVDPEDLPENEDPYFYNRTFHDESELVQRNGRTFRNKDNRDQGLDKQGAGLAAKGYHASDMPEGKEEEEKEE